MSWTIIYHYHDKPIHLSSIINSNPSAQVIATKLEHNLDPKIAWRNSDRILRQNIKQFINNIINNKVLLVEWDLLVNKKIPNIDFNGLLAKNILLDKNNGWCWWKEITNLPDKYKPFISGSPLWSFIGISKDCLIKILDPAYDELYEMDIFCEIRTATLMKSLGFNMTKFPKELCQSILDSNQGNEQVIYDEIIKNKQQGIFHPVKRTLQNLSS